MKLGHRKIVQQLRLVRGRQRRHRFDFDDNGVEAHEVEVIHTAKRTSFVFELDRPLRIEREVSDRKFNGKGITIERLVETAMHLPMDFHRCADDLERL